jgi:hypothetical protein
VEALQLHIGVRYLLLAPLYGYSLRKLLVDGKSSRLVAPPRRPRGELRAQRVPRPHPRPHPRRARSRLRGRNRSAIDLTKVAEAEVAAHKGEHTRVIALLGPWPAPLAIFLRTPEGQMLTPDARALIAKGLGLLGTACVKLGEGSQGEEVMRLAVQYAQDGAAAADIFRRLGEAQLEDGRPGEAVGPLRRAANLGAPPKQIWPLARARLRAPPALRRRPRLRARGPPGGRARQSRWWKRSARSSRASGPSLTAWRGLVVTASR